LTTRAVDGESISGASLARFIRGTEWISDLDRLGPRQLRLSAAGSMSAWPYRFSVMMGDGEVHTSGVECMSPMTNFMPLPPALPMGALGLACAAIASRCFRDRRG
jgi:hypothetical protein